MEGTSKRILRNKDVILEGRYHLGAGGTEVDKEKSQQANTITASTRVRILENYPEYAVLEVTCTCGTKMCLRCEYAGAMSGSNVQKQDSVATESDPMS